MEFINSTLNAWIIASNWLLERLRGVCGGFFRAAAPPRTSPRDRFGTGTFARHSTTARKESRF